jgi:predicted unusual protein kinase regulating ubiquinone biosynthesis (AarF/ABC1/UbiB family)
VTDQVFARFYGMTTEEVVKLDRRELQAFMSQFRDLVFELPFQVPQDYIYLFRAAGILSGMCSSLDPHINYWTLLEPYARKILEQEVTGGLQAILPKATELLSLLVRLPTQADRVLSKALASELEIKMSPNRELQQDIRGLTSAINRLLWGVMAAALMGAGVTLLTNHYDVLGITALAFAGLALLALFLSAGR